MPSSPISNERRIQEMTSAWQTLALRTGSHSDDLIWAFTPLTTSGRHSPSWNAVSWGVEMVGEYQTEPFGNAVRDNTVAALTTLHAVLGRDPKTLRFHKEDPLTSHKTYPGHNVNKADMIKRVNDSLLSHFAGEHSPDSSPG